MSAPKMEIEVRECRDLKEFQACVEVQKRVWGGSDLEVTPLYVFVVMAHNGGQVLGAFAGTEMVGFTLAFPAYLAGRVYVHSHMTAVLPEYRNRGVGRRLKMLQREEALGRGIELVEWTFDPLEIGNAHFNLVRLGAIVRRLLPNCYGVTTSPLHGGLPTDRLLAEWWLRSPRVEACLARSAARAVAGESVPGDAVRILVPANIEELKRANLAEAARVQQQISAQFQSWLGQEYVVTGIELRPEGGSYILEPAVPRRT